MLNVKAMSIWNSYLSLRWRKLLFSSGCSSSKLRLDQLPVLSSPVLKLIGWLTMESAELNLSFPIELNKNENNSITSVLPIVSQPSHLKKWYSLLLLPAYCPSVVWSTFKIGYFMYWQVWGFFLNFLKAAAPSQQLIRAGRDTNARRKNKEKRSHRNERK